MTTEPAEDAVQRYRLPTINGPRRVAADGAYFDVPDDIEMRVVEGSRRQFLYVRHQNRVVVLTRFGELDRSEGLARLDAKDSTWARIGVPVKDPL